MNRAKAATRRMTTMRSGTPTSVCHGSGSSAGTSSAASAFSRSTTLRVTLLGDHGSPGGVELLQNQPPKRLGRVRIRREPGFGRRHELGTGQAERVEGQRVLLARGPDDPFPDCGRSGVPNRQDHVEILRYVAA